MMRTYMLSHSMTAIKKLAQNDANERSGASHGSGAGPLGPRERPPTPKAPARSRRSASRGGGSVSGSSAFAKATADTAEASGGVPRGGAPRLNTEHSSQIGVHSPMLEARGLTKYYS